ncbi:MULTISPECIES: histidine phosphatase family protein [Marivita]|uniref:Histidine phosphatase family protein n=1 Tax=Marivita cryptomonadis TaxID=505252 RepID=A0A9Q2NPD7_9RHOB|nr:MULTISPECIES: histidine phosphatase family protein [Marivita]MCR9169485.1 histidine phosphatase family protein [Paracoccaceae bacterium]MBM2320159.1 histidine phosphatase family protein [Marivita cryptomonadis]MBM2329738.1 histidine phosphatase family protein [Marivita cryptomonadis]MBM2339326.1 histidine phosphatase family protein [Marivita cryptomonadis]MBM2343984.1 histidine phosphatase family protein [Marivita cryptomonadis]
MLKHLIFLILMLPGIALANDWDALESPGAFAIMRHALAPGTGDPANLTVGDCSTQRNLSQQGRDQASRIGQAFLDRGHAFDVVLTSQWCRCRDTADLLSLGPVQEVPAFNSFFQDFSTRDSQTAEALTVLADRTDRPFIVTHQVNIRAVTGQTTRSGEVLVVRHAEDRLEVLGSILIDP